MRYTERVSGVALAGKFFGKKLPAGEEMPSPAYFRALLYQEFHNLLRVRELGFDRAPYRVVRPRGQQTAQLSARGRVCGGATA